MNRNGLSLIELLVVVTLMIIILGALVTLYTTNHQFYTIASIFTELRGLAKNFKNQLAKDIEEAVSVVSSYSGYSTTTTSGLVLKCYGLYSNGDLNTTINDYIAYVYDTGGKYIKRVVMSDTSSSRYTSSRILVEDVDNIIFGYSYCDDTGDTKDYPGEYTDISMTTNVDSTLYLKKTWAGKEREECIISWARLRNKR